MESFENDLLSVPYAVWFSTPSALLLIHSIYCVIKRAKPGNTIGYSIYSFLIIICWITTACSTLINLMELLQILTNVNSVFLGLTVFAWANSIGGTFGIIRLFIDHYFCQKELCFYSSCRHLFRSTYELFIRIWNIKRYKITRWWL